MGVNCCPRTLTHSGRANSLQTTLMIILRDLTLPDLLSLLSGKRWSQNIDKQFEDTCNKYSFVVYLAQRKFEVGGYEFIGMNWVVDYPFRLKDRCRMDTDDYSFQEQFGTGLLSTPDGWQEIDDWFTCAKMLPTIEEELDLLVRPVDMAKSVYVLHMPPYRLGLDKCSYGAEVDQRPFTTF